LAGQKGQDGDELGSFLPSVGEGAVTIVRVASGSRQYAKIPACGIVTAAVAVGHIIDLIASSWRTSPSSGAIIVPKPQDQLAHIDAVVVIELVTEITRWGVDLSKVPYAATCRGPLGRHMPDHDDHANANQNAL
jgi:hypothetical protein